MTVTVPARVLVVDDEKETRELLGMHLEGDGYAVSKAATGAEGLRLAYQQQPDAVILDLRMPGMDGYEVCIRLREITDAAILFLTVARDPDQVVHGLSVGADDFLTKPVEYKVLAARIQACLRRRARGGKIVTSTAMSGAPWKVDESRRLVEIDGRQVRLTPQEFRVFRLFMANPDQVLTPEQILASAWGPQYLGDMDLVKQFVYRLRSKIERDPSKPKYFVTVPGSGYAFEPDVRPVQ